MSYFRLSKEKGDHFKYTAGGWSLESAAPCNIWVATDKISGIGQDDAILHHGVCQCKRHVDCLNEYEELTGIISLIHGQ